MTKKPPPRFVGDRARAKLIDLEWPVEFEGRVFERIAIARLTAREVADFTDMAIKAEPNASLPLPVFRDEAGTPLPVGLLDALDADDRDALNEAALDFLPKRFRGALTSASEPAPGGPTV